MQVKVSLEEITEDTLQSILDLEVVEDQRNYVAPNSVSIAQAHFSHQAWFRAIYAQEQPVGFVMLSLKPQQPEYFLWRFMIDRRQQDKGYGRAAMELVIDFVRTLPSAGELFTSFVPGDKSSEAFYKTLGFRETGREKDGEPVLKRTLDEK